MVAKMNNSIIQNFEIAAPRDKVFRALTESAELERWWTTRAESERKVGGSFRYDWLFPKTPERDHVQQGRYAAFDEGKRVIYPWKAGAVVTEVDFTVEDRGGA